MAPPPNLRVRSGQFHYYLDLVIPRFEEPPKKIGSACKIITVEEYRNKVINLQAIDPRTSSNFPVKLAGTNPKVRGGAIGALGTRPMAFLLGGEIHSREARWPREGNKRLPLYDFHRFFRLSWDNTESLVR